MADNHLLRHLNENMAKFFTLPFETSGAKKPQASESMHGDDDVVVGDPPYEASIDAAEASK